MSGDVSKVLKISRAVGECNLRTSKTSRVAISHENARGSSFDFFIYYILKRIPIWLCLHSKNSNNNMFIVPTVAYYNLYCKHHK